MTNAFQRTAFQHPGFQGGGAGTVTPPVVGGLPHGHGKPHAKSRGTLRQNYRKRHHRIEVQIGDEIFEVDTLQEGYDLLMRARELAKETAEVAANQAEAKAQGKVKPAAVERAFAVPAPQIKLLNADHSLEFVQAIQAQVDAAQVAIDAIYARILMAAREHFERERDEDEAITLMLLHL